MRYLILLWRHGAMLAFGVLHNAASGVGQTFLISLFVPALIAAHGFDRATFGSLYGFATVVSAFLLPIAGRGIDVWPVARYSLAVVTGLVLACVCMALSFDSGIPTLLVALVLLRLFGQGLMGHVSGTTIARHFARSRGAALSLSSVGYPLSEMCLPLLITLGVVRVGERGTFLVAAAVLALVVLPATQWLYAVRGEPEREPAESKNGIAERRDWTRAELVRTPAAWALVPLFNVQAFLLTGLFFHQLALAEDKGWSAELMAASFVAFGVARAAASFLVGPLIDRFGPGSVMLVCLVPFAGGLLVLAASDAPWVPAAYLAGVGLSMGAAGAARTAYLANAFGLLHLGGIRSLFGMLAVLSTAVAPPAFGFLLDQGGSALLFALICLACVAFAAGAGAWGVRRI